MWRDTLPQHSPCSWHLLFHLRRAVLALGQQTTLRTFLANTIPHEQLAPPQLLRRLTAQECNVLSGLHVASGQWGVVPIGPVGMLTQAPGHCVTRPAALRVRLLLHSTDPRVLATQES